VVEEEQATAKADPCGMTNKGRATAPATAKTKERATAEGKKKEQAMARGGCRGMPSCSSR
jgi:hypothetical protein